MKRLGGMTNAAERVHCGAWERGGTAACAVGAAAHNTSDREALGLTIPETLLATADEVIQ
jgi:hypothetical protein